MGFGLGVDGWGFGFRGLECLGSSVVRFTLLGLWVQRLGIRIQGFGFRVSIIGLLAAESKRKGCTGFLF